MNEAGKAVMDAARNWARARAACLGKPAVIPEDYEALARAEAELAAAVRRWDLST